MHYSLNQIELTCRKAVRGAGLDWGLAEDAGRAIRWLELMHLGGVSMLAPLLQEIDHSAPDRLRIRDQEGIWVTTSDLASPLMIGPALCDRINARALMSENGKDTIEVVNAACPLLCVGFAGAAASQTNRSVVLQWDDIQISCSRHSMVIGADGRAPGTKSTTRLIVSIARDDNHHIKGEPRFAEIGSRYIDPKCWADLEPFVHRTYVEATEASRLAGAGAGTIDND